VIRAPVLNQIRSSEMTLWEVMSLHTSEAFETTGRDRRRKAWILGPTDFAAFLKAYVNTVTPTCPLCGHDWFGIRDNIDVFPGELCSPQQVFVPITHIVARSSGFDCKTIGTYVERTFTWPTSTITSIVTQHSKSTN
jgi:hypothetical protein